MTLIDSADSILILYSYSGFPEHSWALLERSLRVSRDAEKQVDEKPGLGEQCPKSAMKTPQKVHEQSIMSSPAEDLKPQLNEGVDMKVARDTQVKMNVMSGLSIILTLMSILVAFRCVITLYLAADSHRDVENRTCALTAFP